MSRRLIAFCASLGLVVLVAGAIRFFSEPSPKIEDASELPTPPFPPRITEGGDYENCLATLATNPSSAIAFAESWQASGGGDGAIHCRGLGLIAVGNPAEGAALLEQLARQSDAPPLARASVLGQAAQARLMVTDAAAAQADASAAVALSPEDPDLLLLRASAETTGGRMDEAVADIGAVLRLDGKRIDALVQRAVLYRNLNKLDSAQADIDRALGIDPDYADALLERGILRQRMGDAAGARADWEHARSVDPNSTTADLASQNLSLLEAGPSR